MAMIADKAKLASQAAAELIRKGIMTDTLAL